MTSTFATRAAVTERVPRQFGFWRSPTGQPAWARPALLAVAALAAALYAWNIADAGYAPFYSMAARSMSVSWKALLYGAVDPHATMTIDKLAGSFVPQALSARIFGFHAWSLALPQVIEGTVSVLAMYRMTRRWIAGADVTDAADGTDAATAVRASAAGLLAAGLFAFTPVVASMFEHSMEDGALTMCLVLAADRYQYAVMGGQLRPLLLAGVWVGLGFQAKMLEAWMIVPALGIGYLLTAPLPLRRRVAHAATAGLVTVLVSVSWMLVTTLTPASDRPYVDGSTGNNVFAMVFGYNGLSRFGVHVPGAVPAENTTAVQTLMEQLHVPPALAQGVTGSGVTGWAKLFGDRFGPEIGWLFPLALISLAAGLWRYRRHARADVLRGGFVMWGLWLATVGIVYSATTIPHAAYLSIMAPPLAALSAAGIVLMWRTRLMPVPVAAGALWAVYLSRHYGNFQPWLLPTVIALSVIAVAGMLVAEARPGLTRAARAVPVVGVIGVAAMVAAPVAWAGSTLDVAYAGSSVEAAAGPVHADTLVSGSGPLVAAIQRGVDAFTGQSASLTPAQSRLLAYVDARRAGAAYAFASDSWLAAEPYVNSDAVPVLPLGGFSGQVPSPTLGQVQHLVATGQLRFFLLNAPGSFNVSFLFGGSSGQTLTAIETWVRATCAPVPSAAYGGLHSPVAALNHTILYHCGA